MSAALDGLNQASTRIDDDASLTMSELGCANHPPPRCIFSSRKEDSWGGERVGRTSDGPRVPAPVVGRRRQQRRRRPTRRPQELLSTRRGGRILSRPCCLVCVASKLKPRLHSEFRSTRHHVVIHATSCRTVLLFDVNRDDPIRIPHPQRRWRCGVCKACRCPPLYFQFQDTGRRGGRGEVGSGRDDWRQTRQTRQTRQGHSDRRVVDVDVAV